MAQLYKQRMKGKTNPNWRGGSIEKICPYCGKHFLVIPREKERRRYCSHNCAGLARRTPTGRYREKKPIVKNKHYCQLCSIEIHSNRVYCRNCSPRGHSTITSYCIICGKSITYWKGYNRHYCSRECYKKGRHGEGNSNWKGGRLSLAQRIRNCEKNRKLIALILKRDKYTCQKCGQIGGDLEVDHIMPFSDILDDFINQYPTLDLWTFTYELSLIALKHKPFWDKKNLRTLCRVCNWQRQVEKSGLKS